MFRYFPKVSRSFRVIREVSIVAAASICRGTDESPSDSGIRASDIIASGLRSTTAVSVICPIPPSSPTPAFAG